MPTPAHRLKQARFCLASDRHAFVWHTKAPGGFELGYVVWHTKAPGGPGTMKVKLVSPPWRSATKSCSTCKAASDCRVCATCSATIVNCEGLNGLKL
jgi:hypothetical protein